MNYPSGIKKMYKKKSSHSNRGMCLESELNNSNCYYLEKNIAVVHKKPTPIKVTKVNYKEGVINEGYFEKPSTTDYNGIYKGKYIDFEAKETISSSSFPLSNIHKHQIMHLRNIQKMGGIGFLIIRFTKLNLTYYLDNRELFEFIDVIDKKSIPLKYFKEKAYLIKDTINPSINYIEIINNLYFKGEENEKKN